MDISSDTESVYSEALALLEKEDYAEAVDRLALAAKNGHIRAQVDLGTMYVTGTGVQCDPKTAFGYFRMAAEGGNPEAQSYLGRMYLNGDGTEQSDKKAFRWLSEASGKGETDALNCLGYMYHEGRGCDKSLDKSIECFAGAAEGGDPEAPYNAGSAYLEKEDYANAAKYFDMGVGLDDPECMAELGLLYRDGKGVEQSGERALELFDAAYEAGNPDGLLYKSTLFMNLIGMVWEAADHGSTKALNQLAAQFKNDPEKIARLKRDYEALLESNPDAQEAYEEFERIIS